MRKVKIAAIIGYVQKGSSKDWHKEINAWIRDLCAGRLQDPSCKWTTSDLLGKLAVDTKSATARCVSKHRRRGEVCSKTIEIRHFWVVMGGSE